MRNLRILVLLAISVMVLSGCGGSAEEPTATPEPTATTVPESPTEAPPEPSVGETVFKTRCASCHNLSDAPQVGPGLKGLFSREVLSDGRAFSDEALADFITGGAGSMPGVPLEQDDLDQLIEYLREATQ